MLFGGNCLEGANKAIKAIEALARLASDCVYFVKESRILDFRCICLGSFKDFLGGSGGSGGRESWKGLLKVFARWFRERLQLFGKTKREFEICIFFTLLENTSQEGVPSPRALAQALAKALASSS